MTGMLIRRSLQHAAPTEDSEGLEATQQHIVSSSDDIVFAEISEALSEDPSVTRYEGSLNSRQKQCFEKLCFTSSSFQSLTCDDSELGILSDSETMPRSSAELNVNQYIIICSSPTSQTTNKAIQMPKKSFVSVMADLDLPDDLLIAILIGTPLFQRFEAQLPMPSVKFVMRLPLANSSNWTLAISWYPDGEQPIRCFALGFHESESADLCTVLRESLSLSKHPLLIPVILCEHLTQSDTNEIKRHGSNLFKIELRTNSLRITNLTSKTARSGNGSYEDELEELTRGLNAITSRLAFHEMRLNANITLVAAIIGNLYDIHKYDSSESDSKKSDTFSARFAANRPLRQRLENLRVEHAALQNEIACNQKIAAGQLQIIYNLIAQRDTRENLRVASISKNIAAITKDDSFAMRTIAIMTVAFLPATAISSIFSMSMFDWQASAGSPVMSNRFWIYWAVAAPLTLAVLSLWLLWMHVHQQQQKKASPELDVPKISSLEIFRPIKVFFARPWDIILGSNMRSSDSEEGNVDEEDLMSSAPLDLPHGVGRTEKFMQGPMR